MKILKKSNGFEARGGSGTSGHPDTDGEGTWSAADTDSEFRSRGRSGTSGHPDTDGERTWPAADTDGEDRFFGQNRDRAFNGSLAINPAKTRAQPQPPGSAGSSDFFEDFFKKHSPQ